MLTPLCENVLFLYAFPRVTPEHTTVYYPKELLIGIHKGQRCLYESMGSTLGGSPEVLNKTLYIPCAFVTHFGKCILAD